MYYKTVFVISTLLGIAFCTLPDYIHPCGMDDPDISACIKNTVNELRPKLVEGIPELDVPGLEPLLLDEIKLRKGIQANVTDIKVWGPSDFEIIDLRANVPKNRFAFIVRLPRLHFNGKYDINSKILFLNLQGQGPIHGNFSNYAFSAVLKGNRIKQGNEEFLKFERMKLNITVGEVSMKLENLFDGNPTLGKAANDVINESSDLIINEIKPALEASLSEKFTEIANKITLRFKYSELFL